jgi:hypothetical protein
MNLNDDYYRPVLKLKCGQVHVFLTVFSPVFILIGSENAIFPAKNFKHCLRANNCPLYKDGYYFVYAQIESEI